MEIKARRQVERVVGYICDVCHNSCNRSDYPDLESHECAILSAAWGYYSNRDATFSECHFCESCYEKLVEFVKSLGGQVREMQGSLHTDNHASKFVGVDCVIDDESACRELLREIKSIEEIFWFDPATMPEATKDQIIKTAREELGELTKKLQAQLKAAESSTTPDK